MKLLWHFINEIVVLLESIDKCGYVNKFGLTDSLCSPRKLLISYCLSLDCGMWPHLKIQLSSWLGFMAVTV